MTRVRREKAQIPVWLTAIRALLAALGVAALGFVIAVHLVPVLLGGTSLTIPTDSMVPTIRPGDAIAAVPVDPTTVHAGQVVVFEDSGGQLLAHRIIKIDGDKITTQGDALRSPDPATTRGSIRWQVAYVVPGGAVTTAWASNPIIAFWLLLGVAVYVAAWIVVDARVSVLRERGSVSRLQYDHRRGDER